MIFAKFRYGWSSSKIILKSDLNMIRSIIRTKICVLIVASWQLGKTCCLLYGFPSYACLQHHLWSFSFPPIYSLTFYLINFAFFLNNAAARAFRFHFHMVCCFASNMFIAQSITNAIVKDFLILKVFFLFPIYHTLWHIQVDSKLMLNFMGI